MTRDQFEASVNFLCSDFGDSLFGEPPIMHPNAIDAAVADMRNKGQFYMPYVGREPISIYQWRDEELARWHEAQEGRK